MTTNLKIFGWIYFICGFIFSIVMGNIHVPNSWTAFNGSVFAGYLVAVLMTGLLTFFIPAKIIEVLEEIRDGKQ